MSVKRIGVFVPPARVIDCRHRAELIAANLVGLKNKDGESGNGAYRYFCGYVGEEAVALWLAREQIPFRHIKSPPGRVMSCEPEIWVGRYRIEVKCNGRPHYDRMIIGEKRDTSASIFILTRTRVADLSAGLINLVAWWQRAEVLAVEPLKFYKGSLCRELHEKTSTRSFSDLLARLRLEAKQ